MKKKALVVGIDEYENKQSFARLHAAEAGARDVGERLDRNGDRDRTRNFAVDSLYGKVTRTMLREYLRMLFEHRTGMELVFYFSGHGVNGPSGGFLVTSDAERNDVGIPMQEVVDLGASSGASSVVLLLDCCSAGEMASLGWAQSSQAGAAALAVLPKNMTVIAASLSGQAALESASSGLFTAALLDALDGAAADLVGDVSVSGVYAHIERRFGPWQQRPVMKSYMTEPAVLRRVEGKLSEAELSELARLFEDEDDCYQLDPEYDPWVDPEGKPLDAEGKPLEKTNPEKLAKGKLFKRYRDAGLVRATNRGQDFWWVAQHRGTLELTPVGKEYRKLFKARQR